eukprot:6181682-Pleurochrysis_carterae.AAC.7
MQTSTLRPPRDGASPLLAVYARWRRTRLRSRVFRPPPTVPWNGASVTIQYYGGRRRDWWLIGALRRPPPRSPERDSAVACASASYTVLVGRWRERSRQRVLLSASAPFPARGARALGASRRSLATQVLVMA